MEAGGDGGAAEGVGRLGDKAGLGRQGADLEPDLGGLAVGADARERRDRPAVPVLGAFAVAGAPRELAEQGQGVHAEQREVVAACLERQRARFVGRFGVARHEHSACALTNSCRARSAGRLTPVELGVGQPELLLRVLEPGRIRLEHDGDQLGAEPAEVADPLGVLEQVQRPLGQRPEPR